MNAYAGVPVGNCCLETDDHFLFAVVMTNVLVSGATHWKNALFLTIQCSSLCAIHRDEYRKADTAIAYSEFFHPAPLLTHRVSSLLTVVTHFQIPQYCSHEFC